LLAVFCVDFDVTSGFLHSSLASSLPSAQFLGPLQIQLFGIHRPLRPHLNW